MEEWDIARKTVGIDLDWEYGMLNNRLGYWRALRNYMTISDAWDCPIISHACIDMYIYIYYIIKIDDLDN